MPSKVFYRTRDGNYVRADYDQWSKSYRFLTSPDGAVFSQEEMEEFVDFLRRLHESQTSETTQADPE